MKMMTQHRLELLLLSTSIISTMFVMQRLWSQTNCDQLCKVMKENQFEDQQQQQQQLQQQQQRWSNSSLNNSSQQLTMTQMLYSDDSDTTTAADRTHTSISASSPRAAVPSASGSAADGGDVVPFSPFDRNHPKLLVILTYQRCGSTFFGNLFNQNNEAFYMFEPLDSLYSSLYGTKLGWNVPSDIANYRNGTLRVMPAIELEKVSEFLQTLLSCQISSLPTETLIHPFIHDYFSKEFSVNKLYVQCVKRHRRKIQNCMQFIPWSYCGGRFGEETEERLNECRLLLSDEQYRNKQSQRQIKIFNDYISCKRQLRVTVDQNCSPFLISTCRSRQLRVIKLVRATMESMEPLLRTFPNFRVIHLIRDPRAVVLSRKFFDSSARGLYSELDEQNMLTKEAILYCRTVVRDVRARQRLEKLYPGKIYSLIYDDMVKDLKGYSEKVYRFIDSKIPSSWLRVITSDSMRKNATMRANKWQTKLSPDANRDIVTVCKEFFLTVVYDWPLTT